MHGSNGGMFNCGGATKCSILVTCPVTASGAYVAVRGNRRCQHRGANRGCTQTCELQLRLEVTAVPGPRSMTLAVVAHQRMLAAAVRTGVDAGAAGVCRNAWRYRSRAGGSAGAAQATSEWTSFATLGGARWTARRRRWAAARTTGKTAWCRSTALARASSVRRRSTSACSPGRLADEHRAARFGRCSLPSFSNRIRHSTRSGGELSRTSG